ncbi:MAG: hypothetical protein QM675_02330 [Protaetiibacter sp.]
MDYDLGRCNIGSTISENEAILEGSISGASDDTSSGTDSTRGSSSSDTTATADTSTCTTTCTTDDPAGPPRDGYDVVVITLADIARFRPTPGAQRMEPDGWVIVGLPANFYSLAGQQVVPGELLGESADVRFTPVSWHWDYGDGATASLGTKGDTWAALGLREFDATPTSHVYQRAGDYTIRLSIVYRAEYRIADGPFTPITGTITLPANELQITAGGAKTVLVDRDCTRAPSGPGC